MQQNSVTPDGLDMPLLIVQGSADVIVAPDVTRRFVDQLCAAGKTVSFLPIAGGDHVSVAKNSADITTGWLKARFSGAQAMTDCAGR